MKDKQIISERQVFTENITKNEVGIDFEIIT